MNMFHFGLRKKKHILLAQFVSSNHLKRFTKGLHIYAEPHTHTHKHIAIYPSIHAKVCKCHLFNKWVYLDIKYDQKLSIKQGIIQKKKSRPFFLKKKRKQINSSTNYSFFIQFLPCFLPNIKTRYKYEIFRFPLLLYLTYILGRKRIWLW